MPKFGDAERYIACLFQVGQGFMFKGNNYEVVKSGKPTCSWGEPKTDVYVLAKSQFDFIEFKISFKKDNADFLENKISAERAEALFGYDWQNIIINATTALWNFFNNKPLIYKVAKGGTEQGSITLGWKFEIVNKPSGELSGVIPFTVEQLFDIYAGTNLPSDKKNAMVNGEVISDCGVANCILMNSNISTTQEAIDNLQSIENYINNSPTVFFACKALNYRTFCSKYDGDRSLAVFVDWGVYDGKLDPTIIFDYPLTTRGNAVADKLKESLKKLNIRTTNDITENNLTIPSKIYP